MGLHHSWTSPFSPSHRSPSLPRYWPQGQSSVSTLYENSVKVCLLVTPTGSWPLCSLRVGGMALRYESGQETAVWPGVCAVYTRGSPYCPSPRDKSCVFHLAYSAKHIKTYFLVHVINRWSRITRQTVGKSFQNITPVKSFLYWEVGYGALKNERAKTPPRRARVGSPCCALRAPVRSGFLLGLLLSSMLLHSFQSALSSHRVCRLISLWARFRAAP